VRAATESWSKVDTTGEIPQPRSGHTAVVYKQSMYLFGGRDGRTHFADLYSLNFGTLPSNLIIKSSLQSIINPIQSSILNPIINPSQSSIQSNLIINPIQLSILNPIINPIQSSIINPIVNHQSSI